MIHVHKVPRTPRPWIANSSPPIRSQDGGDKTLVTFENKTSAPVSIYWIKTDGGEQFYAQIVAGGRLPQETFVGHAWLVKDQNNNCLAVFRSVWRDSIAVIQ